MAPTAVAENQTRLSPNLTSDTITAENGGLASSTSSTKWAALPRSIRRLTPFFILTFFGLQLYSPSLSGKWFADDFPFLFSDPQEHLFRYFLEANPHGYYRPIEASALALSQLIFGEGTLAIHIGILAIHTALAWLVYRTILACGAQREQAWLGSLLMLCSQASVYAISSLDTISQTLGTAAGCASLWLLYRAITAASDAKAEMKPPPDAAASPSRRHNALLRMTTASSTPLSRWRYLASVVFFALALWSKESSLGFSLMIALLLAACCYRGRLRLTRGVLLLLPYFAVSSTYLAVWFHVSSARLTTGVGRGMVQLDSNILVNLGKFIAATTSPISTIDVFGALASRDYAMLGFAAALILLFVAVTLTGIWRSMQRPQMLFMLLLALAATFPAVIMGHVSELHSYNMMPFVAVVAGVGLGHFLIHSQQANPFRPHVAVMLTALILQHALVVRSKASKVAANGARATLLLGQVIAHTRALPPAGALVLFNPLHAAPGYSVYDVHGFDVLSPHVQRLARLRAARPDVTVVIQHAGRPFEMPPRASIVTLRGDVQIAPLKRVEIREQPISQLAPNAAPYSPLATR